MYNIFIEEGNIIEIFTVFLYIGLLLENIYYSLKQNIFQRYIILSTLVILILIQRELNLFKLVCVMFTTLENYRSFDQYLHIAYILPVVVLGILVIILKKITFY